MARTTEAKTLEYTETTYRCDFCDAEDVRSRFSHSCQSAWPRDGCGKDRCRRHYRTLTEDYNDNYPDFRPCEGCHPRCREAWDWAQENARRCESLADVVLRRLTETSDA